jgi:hypothetical protein
MGQPLAAAIRERPPLIHLIVVTGFYTPEVQRAAFGKLNCTETL